MALADELELYNTGMAPGGPPECDMSGLAPEILEAVAEENHVTVWTPTARFIQVKSVGPDGIAGTGDDKILGSASPASRSHILFVELLQPLRKGDLIFAEDELGLRGSVRPVSHLVSASGIPSTLFGWIFLIASFVALAAAALRRPQVEGNGSNRNQGS